ncbi:hypothetical protein ACFY0F_00540 [Streptomyces sp. NPDC001544]|uniref:hypothetical protein n=1 Tax=Streptomyces sp. NPDC001544 TaxID=3364584 RepID=UPI00368B382F
MSMDGMVVRAVKGLILTGTLLLGTGGCAEQHNTCTHTTNCGNQNAATENSAAAGSPKSVLGTDAKSAAEGPLRLSTHWPAFRDCDGATSVAMPAGGRALDSFALKQQDFRTEVTQHGGGVWGSGHLYLDISAEQGKTIVVDDIRPQSRVPERIKPPAWVALTQGGCGDVYGRAFELDLDRPKLTDKGVQGMPQSGEPTAPANPLGPAFKVTSEDPAVVRIDAQACRGNYSWSLVIDYSYDGKSYSKAIGPFKSMGKADAHTVTYIPDPMTGKPGKAQPAPEKGIGCV